MEGSLEDILAAPGDENMPPIDAHGNIHPDSDEESAVDQDVRDDEDSHAVDQVQITDHDTASSETEPTAPALSAGIFDSQAVEMDDEPPPPAPDSLVFAERDVGDYANDIMTTPEPAGEVLESDKSKILQDLYNRVGTKQVTASELAWAPSWLLDEAIEAEHMANWTDVYEVVDINALPDRANVISSHYVFKIKDEIGKPLRLKARLVLHGNRDVDKDNVRRDSASAELTVVRLVLALATLLGFSIATADVRGAYMQSGEAGRNIYVRTRGHLSPPPSW